MKSVEKKSNAGLLLLAGALFLLAVMPKKKEKEVNKDFVQ